MINGRDADAVAAAVDESPRWRGPRVRVVGPASEVADEIVATAVRRFGALDVAINAPASPNRPSTIQTITREQFEEQIDAHLMSAFALTQAAGRLMAEQGSVDRGPDQLRPTACSAAAVIPPGRVGSTLTLAAAADLGESRRVYA